MEKPLSIFNWSLKKALDTEPDNFIRARIRIIYTILVFSILKIIFVTAISIANEQWLQVMRAVAAFVFGISLIKFLLYKPARLNLITHVILQIGILIVWSNLFIYTHKINLPTIQFVFMIILSSFYTLGSVSGIIYSSICILPIVLFLSFHGNTAMYFTSGNHELASPGFEIIVVLNFITITVAHYLFYKAYHVNIAEKENLNGQLQLSIAEANKLAASRADFLSTMSHELRTPLNSVIGITELLLEDKPEERQKENLKILQLSTLDLLALINNVLDFNKVESGKPELEKISFHLDEFMRQICSVLRVKADDKKIDFILDIDEQLKDAIVISDPTRLSQLVYNLAGNAIKFTDKGSVTVRLDIVGSTAHSVDVLFSITDTGIGIHPDKHEKIFELFTQAEVHTTRKYGGTGLGLAIVKQVAALFDTAIQLESTPGEGSRFFFTVTLATAEKVKETSIPELIGKPDLGHLKILIAEDNEVNRLIMKKQLGNLDITNAHIVENGRQAYDAYLSGQYDAIFMDLHMPVMDGYATTRLIRTLTDKTKAGIYIVAFTASVTEQQQILNSGFDDFLYKPVSMNDLREKLEKITSHCAARTSV